ncbi:MAG: four helix bundle protein [Pirellulaceae bacterium]
MPLAHERLEVYRVAVNFVAWTQPMIESLPAKVSARDQLERASTSIALNIAEGNGKHSLKERLRYWQIAEGSAVESSACLDVLVARKLLPETAVSHGKEQIESIVRMLNGLRRRFSTKESTADYVVGAWNQPRWSS